MSIQKIISGGQTGADQGGLAFAAMRGLETGGWAPRGWRTETGPAPFLGDLGLKMHESSAYPPRTELNVRESDVTLIFGNTASRGCFLTESLCYRHKRPVFLQPWRSGNSVPSAAKFKAFLLKHRPEILNVAGNRESTQPGISHAVISFLERAL